MQLVRLLRPFDKRRAKQTPFADMFTPYQGDEIVSLDCETTSLDPKSAEIITLAAVKICQQKVMMSQKLSIKIQPKTPINADSIPVHHIRNQDIEGAMSIEQALPLILNFIGNRPILGYFIKFDLAVLSRYTEQAYGFHLPNRPIELCHVYYKKVNTYYPDAWLDHKFETLATTLDIPILGRHTAMGDAITVALMYLQLNYGKRPSLL
ncbi:3'-5' exonuclease [Motilimonas eburnea]|uniref:3'-5' exonuclease n=1 Tax=Motilimonas eburnea TaxID=1737488 RepID=UPI001E43A932|nr:3'-5' exonuclease [Motilimonas eburnea]MCE2572772.1 3'-5' exonuclease [Motilimonas eburnea]